MPQQSSDPTIIIGVIIVFVSLVVFWVFLQLIDRLFLLILKRPLWVHFYLKKLKLTKNQKAILKTKFSFYNRLSRRNKNRFEHRVTCFIQEKEFIGRNGCFIDDEKKVLIASTAILLTFGMRDYLISIIDKIIVYPKTYYSTLNKEYHKGEFVPMLKAIAFSWEDFKEGFRLPDDNINLGIHEFTHAIHFNCMKNSDISSIRFIDSFSELQQLLLNNEFKNELKESQYFRDYAFVNRFEFLAVVLENFIESPKDFRQQFPSIYRIIKEMFNFRFSRY